MQESSRPHPLDASDDDDNQAENRWSKEPTSPSIAFQPLLKPSLRLAAMATVVLAVSSVLAATFSYGSEGYNISATIFPISGAVLVFALVGVLVAFRIGYLRAGYSQRHPRRQATVFRGYRGFVFSNLIGLAAVWTVLLCAGWGFGAVAAAVGSPLMLIGGGLLATMIFTHDGYLRAYAIGSLTALAQFSGFSSVASLILFNGGGFGRGFGGAFGRLDMLTISLGLTLTIVIVSGLVSSGYVVALTGYARRQRELLQQQATDQTMSPTNHANERE